MGPNRNMVRERPDYPLESAIRAVPALIEQLWQRPVAVVPEAVAWLPGEPNPYDTRSFGIDVSRYNLVDWVTVANFQAPRVDYCMVRLGQAHRGAYDDLDRRFLLNWAHAKAIARRRHGYHVLYPASPIGPQVENVQRIGRLVGYDWGDAPFWIDVELHQGLTGAQIIAAAWDFLRRLQDLMGIAVGIYTGKWFIDRYKLPIQTWWAELWWWLAQYGTNREATIPLQIPAGIPDERVLIQQTTSKGEGMLFGAPLGNWLDYNRQRVPLAV